MEPIKCYPPGIMVKVIKGPFSGKMGVLIDASKAVDQRGNLYPPPSAGYYWILLSLNDSLFPAHMHHDEIEAVAVPS